jgi:hypothetical protein
MKKMLNTIILILMLLSSVLAGCTITGKAVQQVEEYDRDSAKQIEKDTSVLISALNSNDPSLCYYIQTKSIKFDCFDRFI